MLNSWIKMEASFYWINGSMVKKNQKPALQTYSNVAYILFFGLIYVWYLKSITYLVLLFP